MPPSNGIRAVWEEVLLPWARGIEKRLASLESQVNELGENGNTPDWNTFNELQETVDSHSSALEDIEDVVRRVSEKIGALEADEEWKYVGVKDNESRDIVFAKVAALKEERVEVVIPYECVRFLVEKTYNDDTPALDEVRRDKDGGVIPHSLEEAIESVRNTKSMLKYASELLALLGDSDKSVETDGSSGTEIVGAADLYKREPLSKSEEKVLEYLEKYRRIAKRDLKLLKPLLEPGVDAMEAMRGLVYRGLVGKEKMDDDDYYVYAA